MTKPIIFGEIANIPEGYHFEGRNEIYNSLMQKMLDGGFVFEKEQKPHHQNKKEKELKFTHPQLIKKLEDNGYKVKAKKFYIKPLSEGIDSEIGLVTGKSSPLNSIPYFNQANSTDSFDKNPAWTNTPTNQAIDDLLKSIKNYLNDQIHHLDKNEISFLLTWNPQKYNWVDLQNDIEQLEEVGYVEKRWSCGNTKKIKQRNKIYLMKVGKGPNGIMGSGYTTTSSYSDQHWDGTEGKITNYINVKFDELINCDNYNIFNKEKLANIDPKNIQQWFPQNSGISLNTEVSINLEKEWLKFISEEKAIQTIESLPKSSNNYSTIKEEALFTNWLLENHQQITKPKKYVSAIKSISNDLQGNIDVKSIYDIKDISELKKIQIIYNGISNLAAKNSRGNNMYSRALDLYVEYVSYISEDNQDTTSKDIIEIINSDDQEKVKERLILARIGQGQFRKELIDIWNGCSISNYADVSLLIASHIKPWSKCENHEKTDPNNGLLLLPNYDKLFDKGYISFDENGMVIISKRLNKPEIFGIRNNMNIKLTEDNKRYMKYHREEVFK